MDNRLNVLRYIGPKEELDGLPQASAEIIEKLTDPSNWEHQYTEEIISDGTITIRL